MKSIFIITSLILCLNLFAEMQISWTLEDRKKEADQIEFWKANLEKSAIMQSDEKLEFLSTGLKNMAHRMSMNDHSPEIDSVYRNILESIIFIPGHAEYFGNQINRERKRIENDRILKNAKKPDWTGYDTLRISTIQTLTQLPSPESVKVLGELLSDRERTIEVDPKNFDADSFGTPPNASLAAGALKSLIDNPPVPVDRAHQLPADIDVWQSWYEQIKAGTFTFRLKGDPTEYDLHGPASKEKLIRIERDRKRDEERSKGLRKSSAVQETRAVLTQVGKPSTIAGVLAALGVFVAAVWWVWRRKKAVQG